MKKMSQVHDSGVDIPDMVESRPEKMKGARKWEKFLGREREWDESRWEWYMRYWKYRMRARERGGESKRRRYLEKAREAYSAYCKRFETCVSKWNGLST